jgi:hypothetical protein
MKKLGLLAIVALAGTVALVGCGSKEEAYDSEMQQVQKKGEGQQNLAEGQQAPNAGLPMPPGKSGGGAPSGGTTTGG